MAKKSIPGTGSATGKPPSKQVPVAPKQNGGGRFGMAGTTGVGMKGAKSKGSTGGKRGC